VKGAFIHLSEMLILAFPINDDLTITYQNITYIIKPLMPLPFNAFEIFWFILLFEIPSAQYRQEQFIYCFLWI